MPFKNLGPRLLVAILAGPFVLAAAWFGRIYFLLLIGVLILISSHEFLAILAKKQSFPARIPTYAAGLGVAYFAWRNQAELLVMTSSLYLFILLLVELFERENNAIRNVAGGLLVHLYAGLLLAFMAALRELPALTDRAYRAGGEWLVLVFLSIWVCDSMAYFVGSRFGRHKLAPAISPNKSVEGAIGGVFGAVLTAWACQLWFAHSLTAPQALVIGGICGLIGQMSDLAESMIKRDANLKDTSNLLPGHGGVLDRFDSELLAVPVIYFYLRLTLG